MPIIIDANRSGDFSHPISYHAGEIVNRVSKRRLRVAVGGYLLQELMNTRLRGLIVEWQRAGLLQRESDNDVNLETERFRAAGLTSDDPHVMALASISGCRLLYTADADLMIDFKDRAHLSPKGKIISTSTTSQVACALLNRFGS